MVSDVLAADALNACYSLLNIHQTEAVVSGQLSEMGRRSISARTSA